MISERFKSKGNILFISNILVIYRMTNLEELEKQFIINEDMEHEDIKISINRLLKFCKIDEKGFVIIQKSSLNMIQKIMLVLSARYLASNLQKKLGREKIISDEISANELTDMLREKNTVVIARLKDLKDTKKIISSKRGIYKVASYAIDDFLTELESVKNE